MKNILDYIYNHNKEVIEIGHFYLDNPIFDLDYLHLFKREINFKKYICVILIDDIHIKNNLLDINKLSSQVNYILETDVLFVYESELRCYEHLLSNIETTIKNYKKEKKLQITYQDKYYTIKQLTPVNKIYCLGYSIIWSLIRLNNNRKTITIINEKYINVEKITNHILPKNSLIQFK